MSKLIALPILTVALVGCVSLDVVVTEPPDSTTSPTSPRVASPAPVTTPAAVAPTLAPVSASHPGTEAAAVLATCRIGEGVPVDEVAGMAKLPSARDLPHYAPLTGREPVLREPGPLWVVQIKGDVPEPMSGEIWTNPICIVSSSDSGYLGTGPITNLATGRVTPPEPPAVPPDRTLPPLAP